jgi:hypothetical protein
MCARQAVLLTPPRSSHATQLLSRQHRAPITPLDATHTQPPSKCCKQMTYAIPNSFECNTYKKHGVGPSLPARSERLGVGVPHFNAPTLRPFYFSTLPLSDYFSPRVFNRLRTLPSYVSRKSFACHSYENCRVYTNNSHCGTQGTRRWELFR